jgi:hypothetical protein
MILTVSGWRDWDQGAWVVHQHLERYLAKYGPSLRVRVGDAEGVDRHVRDWLFAMEQSVLGLTYCVYRADWGRHGRAAGPMRNDKMLRGDSSIDPTRGETAKRLLAFPEPGIDWRAPGSGTVDCILQAVKLGVSLDVPGFVRREPTGLWD